MNLVIRYDNVTLIPLVLQLGLRIGPIQRMGASRKWLEKLTGVKDKYM